MTDRIPKSALIGAAIVVPVLALVAYSQPAYFADQTYLAGLVFLEFVFAALWMYRQVFFPLILLAFLFAGTTLPVGGGWTVARWVVLGIGAMAGCVILAKDRRLHFGLFHTAALFAIFAALVSAVVSRYPSFALLKALSVLLLFVYAGTGARLAVAGREARFFAGLVNGCEIYVGAMALFYLFGRQVMGNPNSLGAVMGVVAAPVLLWGIMVAENRSILRRRSAVFALCMALTYYSHARAGMAAAALSCGLLCLGLRKYRMFGQGMFVLLIFLTTVAIFNPSAFSRGVSSLTSSVVYKGHDSALGLLASRESPWQSAMDNIRDNFWFGTGFGTTDTGEDASARLDKFSTASGVTAENGSSYLAIIVWVGMLGVLPFLFLLFSILRRIYRTLVWMFRTGSPSHPAVPLAMVLVAGLLHAGFEDWLFAPGYYLCVFFWSMAFVFVDLAPRQSVASVSANVGQPWLMERAAGSVAPSR